MNRPATLLAALLSGCITLSEEAALNHEPGFVPQSVFEVYATDDVRIWCRREVQACAYPYGDLVAGKCIIFMHTRYTEWQREYEILRCKHGRWK